MFSKKEHFLEFNEEKAPQRVEDRWVFSRALELTRQCAAKMWVETNQSMEKSLDRSEAQIMVLTPHLKDVTPKFLNSLKEDPLGKYPVATTLEQEFPDGELDLRIINEAAQAQSLYIVASILNERDFSRVRKVADHYKDTLNACCVTLLSPFLSSTRQDKNIELDGRYRPSTLNIRAELRGLAGVVDRMVVIEPHSSATQAFAAEFGIPLLSLSPWKLMTDHLKQTGISVKENGKEQKIEINPQSAVGIRPDRGRIQAAKRIGQYLGLPSVSFDKVRISGQEVDVYELPKEERELVRDRIGLIYDDEISTMGTIYALAGSLERYQAKALVVCVAHGKFTPGWETRIGHPLIKTVLCTDSREPIGNVALNEKIQVVSLAPLLRQIIAADIKGVNFWASPEFQNMILQEEEVTVQ